MFKTLTTEQFIQKASKIHNNRYRYWNSIYVNSHTKLIITCLEHGDFLQTPNSHLNGNGCPGCKSSKGEETIRLILEKHGIEFEREYMIPGVTPRYRYDFYLPYQNLFIEFHGIQHYKPVEIFGGEEAYKETVTRDMLKKSIAKMIGVRLFHFNYLQLKQLSLEQFEEIVLRIIYNSAKLYK